MVPIAEPTPRGPCILKRCLVSARTEKEFIISIRLEIVLVGLLLWIPTKALLPFVSLLTQRLLWPVEWAASSNDYPILSDGPTLGLTAQLRLAGHRCRGDSFPEPHRGVVLQFFVEQFYWRSDV